MKNRILLAALVTSAACGTALADDSGSGLDLCRHGAVRQAIKLEQDLRPVKEVYEIVSNPTGFLIKTVTQEAGIKIPRFVGYAMDPEGSLRAAVMKRVREQVKKQGGLQNDCAVTEAQVEEGDEGPFPTPEADASDA